MGQPQPPQPVKLIVGMLGKEQALFGVAEAEMQNLWGGIDIYSGVMAFTQTDYYRKQMGGPLWRKFVSFESLITPEKLADIKHHSNGLEETIGRSEAGRSLGVIRPVNLDPGYIEPSKLVLATTKNYSHRIYIGRSIYAEATLRYHQGAWHAWPYTYPDYQSGEYDAFLSRVRDRLMEQLSSQK